MPVADNTTMAPASGGDVLRTLSDGTVKWPAGVSAYVLNGGPGAYNFAIVDLTHGLPVQPQTGSVFPVTDAGGSFTVDAPVATPVFVRLSDGTNPVAIGQGVMAAGLPVSIASDQTPGANRTATATLNGVAQTVQINTQGCASVSFSVSGAYVASMIPEVSNDGGTTWQSTPYWSYSAWSGNSTLTSAALPGTILCNGFALTRLRMSAFTSGAALVTMSAGAGGPSFGAAIMLGQNGSSLNTTTCNTPADLANNNSFYTYAMGGTLSGASTWDRLRGNYEVPAGLLASAARTAAINTADQTNWNGRGVVVVIDVTAASGTGGLTVTLKGKDAVSGKYYTLIATTNITATGTYLLYVYPGIAAQVFAGAATPGQVNMVLPRLWRVEVAVGDASSYTYSVGSVIQL